MKIQFILLLGFYMISLNIIQAQDYLQLGNDCFNKGDYVCAKKYYEAQKIDGSAFEIDEKISQCDKCINLLREANRLLIDKKFQNAKSKYEDLLVINPEDPHAKKQIEQFNSNSAWVEKYERHLSAANGHYNNKNYQSAIDEYNEAIRQIPSDASNASDLKNSINSKIRDCTQKINDANIEKLRITKRDANSAFEQKNWERAYTLYQEVKRLDPNDYTGYNNFLKLAKDMIAIIGGCDNNIKTHLNRAKNLRNTTEVNDLLKKCN